MSVENLYVQSHVTSTKVKKIASACFNSIGLSSVRTCHWKTLHTQSYLTSTKVSSKLSWTMTKNIMGAMTSYSYRREPTLDAI